MHTFASLAALQEAQGKDLGLSDWLIIRQPMIDNFAAATLDHQWIHTDPERAAEEGPFGGTIAHGFMSLSLLSAMIESMVKLPSVRLGINYGLNKVRFPNHVPVNSRIRLQLKIGQVEWLSDNSQRVVWDCLIEREGEEKPVCVAEFVTMFYE